MVAARGLGAAGPALLATPGRPAAPDRAGGVAVAAPPGARRRARGRPRPGGAPAAVGGPDARARPPSELRSADRGSPDPRPHRRTAPPARTPPAQRPHLAPPINPR